MDKIRSVRAANKVSCVAECRDIVIVGAGPAGSVLALLLARRGFDVLLLDRADFPRDKPCGDCLSAEATRLLERIGVLEPVYACGPARLRGWSIHAGRHALRACFAQLGDPDPRVHEALALPRRELDRVLLEAARAAGATVLTGAHVHELLFAADAVAGVRVRTGDHERAVRARLTVGADGLRSRVARRLHAIARAPRIRRLSLSAHCAVGRDLANFGEMHTGSGLCVGVAPITADADLHNVTVVADADRFGREVAHDAHGFFARALERLPALRLGAVEPGELLASGPFDVPVRRTVFDGAALVGDAAGYFDPFTGQGVYQAIAGAERLAPVAAQAVHASPHAPVPAHLLMPYAAALRELTGPARCVQRLIDGVLSRPRLGSAALALLERRPAAARALVAVTADLRPARSLRSTRFALSLLTPGPRTAP